MWGASAVLVALLVPALAERMNLNLARLETETETPNDGPVCTVDDHKFEGEDDAVETLSTAVDEDKQHDPAAVKPFSQLKASMKYEEVGCFSLEEHDEGNGGPEAPERDPYCRDFRPEDDAVKCRSGLPFYRKALQRQGGAEFRQCMEYCLTVGLDIFGLVEPGKGGVQMETVECRCGASKDNLQAWADLVYKNYLIAELWENNPKKEESEECPVRIGRYDPEWIEKHGNGGTPVSLLRMTVQGNVYMHQIFHATQDTVAVEERLLGGAHEDDAESPRHAFVEMSSSGGLSVSSNRTRGYGRSKAMYERDCARQQCASGKAWGNRIYYAFTNDIDTKREMAYTTALERIAAHIPCIEFVLLKCKDARGKLRTWGRCFESDLEPSDNFASRSSTQAPANGVILVGNREPLDPRSGCYTAGLGFPGRYGMRFINLGWCNSNMHIGNMMHETGHALGMAHEHSRPDGAKSYKGQGPFLEIFTDKIRSNAIKRAKEKNPAISKRELEWEVQNALYQYEPDENAYMGSTARGGRTPFDYGSIMMYPVTEVMRSNRRRSTQAALSGCHDEYCLDDMMGQRADYSEEDVLQLRDMLGCLPTPRTRCPAIYGSELVDDDGDCQCPSGTICYNKGTKGCPFARQTAKLHTAYFAHDCKDCRCVAPSCPANAGSVVGSDGKLAPPDKDGDCKCPPSTVCRLGSGFCPSSLSNNDHRYFSDTCDDCVCRPSCSADSNAVDDVADEDGNCLCPIGTQCYTGDAETPGCKKEPDWLSYRGFAATCRTCMCKEAPPPSPTCARSKGEAAVSETPDKMGDCLCPQGTLCFGGPHICTYSGGKSLQYFSAECSECTCQLPETDTERRIANRPLFLMHDRCEGGYIPTKCGATQAQVGRLLWDLDALGLSGSECGRCVMALQASRTRDACEFTADGKWLSDNYQIVASASKEDLCCQVYSCKQDQTQSVKDPCEGYKCGENAECVVEESAKGVKEAMCMCYEGFDAAANGVDCVPEVPAGSRCCSYVGRYMWVPAKYLERSRHLGCASTNKYICPIIMGKRWLRGSIRHCNKNPFVYKGNFKTPLNS